MTTSENNLWTKIASFQLDEADSAFKFSTRLARENGWSIAYSLKVIEEYKKYIFLCCVSTTGATPSDQVDQAWHLHLTYTKSYWTDLCKNTLAKEIHHNPTKGGTAEGKKFDDFYTDTLKLYKDKFKTDPPKSIWPDNEKRFSDINFQRVNLKSFWLIRRPDFKNKYIGIFLIAFLALFFIQSQSSDNIGIILGAILLVCFAFGAIFKNKSGGGGSGGSGGSGCSGACSGGDSGHSGCSGCGGGSGCSGCGGGD